MVLRASQALGITLSTITIQDNQKLQREITNTESTIRRAGNKEEFFARHDATILGNPIDDVHNDDNLTDLQILYRDAMVESGYVVSLDSETGLWKFDWSITGSEQEAFVYSIRTTVLAGAVDEQTENSINLYFASLEPRVTSKTQVVTINGGDIDEGDFGAAPSVFYEYYSVTSQPDNTDYSTNLKTWLVAAGLGYTSANIEVYQIVQ